MDQPVTVWFSSQICQHLHQVCRTLIDQVKRLCPSEMDGGMDMLYHYHRRLITELLQNSAPAEGKYDGFNVVFRKRYCSEVNMIDLFIDDR